MIDPFLAYNTGDGEVVSFTRRSPFTSGRFLVPISVRGRVGPGDIAQLEGLGQPKSPITSSAIEPEIFQLVA
jgi:hypothetical protein